MFDVYDPYNDEERQRALEALGTAGQQPDPNEPDPAPAIQALAKEANATSTPPHGDRVASQSAPANIPVQAGDDSGPGLNGWAVAADLVFNRGRGLGQIISMAEQQKKDWLKAKGAANDPYKLGTLDVMRRQADLRARELDQADRALKLREGKGASYGGGSGQPLTQANATALYGAPPEPGPGPAEVPPMGDSDIPYDRTPPVPGEGVPEGDMALPLTPKAQAAADKEARGTTAIPGTKIRDEAAAAGTLSNPSGRKQLEDTVGMFVNADEALKRMVELRKQYGVEMFSSPARAEYDMLQKQVASAYSKLGNTGVLSKEEFERYAKEMPGIGFTDDPTGNTARAVAGLVGRNYDPTLDKLLGTQKATQTAITNALYPKGLDYVGREKPKPEPVPAPEVVAEPIAPPPPAGDRLPVTSDKRPPALGGLDEVAAKSGKTSHTLKMPSGKTKTFTLSPEELQQLIAAGAQEI